MLRNEKEFKGKKPYQGARTKVSNNCFIDHFCEGIPNGCRTAPKILARDIAAAPENSVVTLGGKNPNDVEVLHIAKTHKDCPNNPKKTSSSS